MGLAIVQIILNKQVSTRSPNPLLCHVISENSACRIFSPFASKFPFVVSADRQISASPITFGVEIIKPKQASKPLNSRVQRLLPPLIAVLPFRC